MGLLRRKQTEEEEETKQKKRRFSFTEKYSIPIGFVLFAGLLVGGYLPDINPLLYLVLGPFLFRLFIDIATGQTIGKRIIRTLHPKILAIDIGVMVLGLVALYITGYWTLDHLSPVIAALDIVFEQFGYSISITDAGAANITGT